MEEHIKVSIKYLINIRNCNYEDIKGFMWSIKHINNIESEYSGRCLSDIKKKQKLSGYLSIEID